ncbi:hypothetical protein MSG28_002158 [Choristoneura fumiferana]|uniref:Uncharacterized protein n=1 Tax=Choristoneura fumiferana TaxID=7141 RepID=A0ACC0JUL5_CHOFU|nr:hypothetical protein MSG28_002158 [Choristoneura fumiferana]
MGSHIPEISCLEKLLQEIRKNSTMILIGETGCGKTTQIPQLIHEQRLEGKGCIAVTQPRRVAAITIAIRVAAEMNTEIGNIVGYSVRFEDVTSPRTKLKYLTDGMLLREAIVDPLLKKYSVVILDEAHERTVSTDILFGIVKLAQKERIDKNLNPLKVIVMSATMDVDTFRNYFDNCPVIYLEGRAYPVTIYHSKIKQEDYQYAAVCTLFELHRTMPANNDFLVFLTGQEEIEAVMYNIKQIAKEAPGPPLIVCPLYAGLPAAKQLQVWKPTPPGMRKVVLATNIAEASVTIPQIKCVIDTGVVKERTWCTATGAERLRVGACAQAAAWQRAGRAGRTAAGAAYRLFTASDFRARPSHATPEIVRCPLAPTILLLIAAGMEPSNFPLIDSPPSDSINASLTLLKELGAIDSETNIKLTALGKKMASFPIDPKYSKVLLSAPEFNCLDEALSLVAMLSSENIFHTPMHKREEALRIKQKFISPLGDHITLLNVFKAFSKAVLKKLLKCLVSGLFTNCAWVRGAGQGAGRYVTAAGAAASLHPGGALHSTRPPPPAVLYSELLHTRRAYLVTVSAIQPQWLHQLVPDYARRCRANR